MQRKEAQSVGEIIAQFLKEQNLDLKINETKIIKGWPLLMGESIAQYTTGLYIRDKVLTVQLSSSVLRNELMMCRHMIIKRLNNYAGSEVIINIIFR